MVGFLRTIYLAHLIQLQDRKELESVYADRKNTLSDKNQDAKAGRQVVRPGQTHFLEAERFYRCFMQLLGLGGLFPLSTAVFIANRKFIVSSTGFHQIHFRYAALFERGACSN